MILFNRPFHACHGCIGSYLFSSKKDSTFWPKSSDSKMHYISQYALFRKTTHFTCIKPFHSEGVGVQKIHIFGEIHYFHFLISWKNEDEWKKIHRLDEYIFRANDSNRRINLLRHLNHHQFHLLHLRWFAELKTSIFRLLFSKEKNLPKIHLVFTKWNVQYDLNLNSRECLCTTLAASNISNERSDP